ncbi:MAG: hypothetical protein QOG22_3478, partial [Pseudonocardiales bacterium]|nr:hypothetical protein [Pseudonocardiales bacterium]
MTALACDGNGVDAVRADGGLVHIRTAAASDMAGLRALCASAAERPAELQVNLRQLTTAGNLERLLAPSD